MNDMIEVTPEQLPALLARGVKLKHYVTVTDLLASLATPTPAVISPPVPSAEARAFEPSPNPPLTSTRKAVHVQQFPRNRLVILCANPEVYVKRYEGKMRQAAEAVMMLMQEKKNAPIRKGDLSNALAKFMNDAGISPSIHRLCVDGFLQVVEARSPNGLIGG